MRKMLIVVVVTLALAAACSDDGGTSSATDAPFASDRIMVSSSPSESGDGITAGGDCQDATKADGPADLEMQDFVFAPPCLEMTTAQGLRIHNEGEAEHNFSVEGISGIDIDVSAGDENNTEATGLMPGSYTFFCKYHRESNDMEGKLVVKSA